MRNKALYILAGLSLLVAGCNTNSIPPADGIYTGQMQTSTTLDNVYVIIDSTGAGVLIDQTNPSITSFKLSSVDDNGNFSATTTTFAGSGFGVTATAGTPATTGTISGTLDGNSSNVVGGGNAERNTINISAFPGATTSFTLTYQAGAYENNVTQLSTIVTPTNVTLGAATLSYSYTPTGGNATNVILTLSSTATTASDGSTAYPISGSDNQGCSYTGGAISMPNTSYNAYEITLNGTCNGQKIPTRTGLAYVNGTSPLSLAIEYNDTTSFAVAANAQLNN